MTQKQQSQPCFPCDSRTVPHSAVRRPPLVVPPAGKSEACRSCNVLDAVPNPRLWLRGTNVSFRGRWIPGYRGQARARAGLTRRFATCAVGTPRAAPGASSPPAAGAGAFLTGSSRPVTAETGGSAAEFPPSMELYLRERTLPPSFFSSRPRFPQQAPAPLLSVAPSRTASCRADPARCPPLKNGTRSFSMEPRGARAAAGVAVSREGGATFRLFPLPLAVA